MTSTVAVEPSPLREADLLRVAGRRAEERVLELGRHRAGAELDDRVALRLAVGVDEVDDERVAGLRRAAVRGRELGDGLAQHLDLGVDRLLRGPRPRRAATSSSVQSTISGSGCTSTVAAKLQPSSAFAGSSYSYCGLGDGADAAARSGAPEPAADVAVDGLGVDAVLAEARDEDRLRDLALPEPRDLGRLREIVQRVLDRVLHLLGRDLDGQADAVLADLFDLRRHSAIQPASGRRVAPDGALRRRRRRRRRDGQRRALPPRPPRQARPRARALRRPARARLLARPHADHPPRVLRALVVRAARSGARTSCGASSRRRPARSCSGSPASSRAARGSSRASLRSCVGARPPARGADGRRGRAPLPRLPAPAGARARRSSRTAASSSRSAASSPTSRARSPGAATCARASACSGGRRARTASA